MNFYSIWIFSWKGKHILYIYIYMRIRFICLFERNITTARFLLQENLARERISFFHRRFSFPKSTLGIYTPTLLLQPTPRPFFSSFPEIVRSSRKSTSSRNEALGSLRAKLEFRFDARNIPQIFINATFRENRWSERFLRASPFIFLEKNLRPLFLWSFKENLISFTDCQVCKYILRAVPGWIQSRILIFYTHTHTYNVHT